MLPKRLHRSTRSLLRLSLVPCGCARANTIFLVPARVLSALLEDANLLLYMLEDCGIACQILLQILQVMLQVLKDFLLIFHGALRRGRVRMELYSLCCRCA